MLLLHAPFAGTGKTLVMSNLLNSMSSDANGATATAYPITVTFSARSSSEVTQAYIESKLERRHADLLGAPAGKMVCV